MESRETRWNILLSLETRPKEGSRSVSEELAVKSKACLRARPWRAPYCRPAPWMTSTTIWWVQRRLNIDLWFFHIGARCLSCESPLSVLKVEEATVVMEDDSPDEPAIPPEPQRNLLAWSITIPYIDFYDDDIKKERILVFSIHVERNDKKNGEQAERKNKPWPGSSCTDEPEDVCRKITFNEVLFAQSRHLFVI